MSAVVQELGEYLYRYKGILSIDGWINVSFSKAYIRYLLLRMIESGKKGEDRVSEVVFIGKDINKEWFQAHFEECVK